MVEPALEDFESETEEDVEQERSLRVLIVDDHPVVLTGLRGMISSIPGIVVVGESREGNDAIDKAAELKPDVILMDVRLPGLNGLEVLRRIKEKSPEIEIVLITVSESDLYLVEGLRWGASGYLMKDSSKNLIGFALKSAVEGGTVISTQLLNQAFGALVRSTQDFGEPREEGGLPSLVELTPRELDVLRLVAKGMTNRAICTDLSLAEVTVKKHVQSIMGKMGARDRTQAAIRAVRLGIID
ncbi:MAG: response regulator transcription factor [Armatimonadetes bacterium]|nr:response regulator transcription factor [Armatimonadota bacterium]